jgi:ABC-type Fe3+-hydroxamate transport system substrate-binding protein
MFWSGKDALGRPVCLPERPERIVSLVPSQTELLMDLGVGARLVGRTRYCIHPKERVSGVALVGGTKRMEFDKIRALQPDFFLAEKEETPKAAVESLSDIAPVYVTDVISIATAISMIESVGGLVGRDGEGKSLARRIQAEMSAGKVLVRGRERVLYLIWKKPWMAAGMDTFIHSCLDHIGFRNAVADLPITDPANAPRYPEISIEAMRSLRPDRVLLSSEPYPFQDPHVEELRALVPNVRIERVDGEMFSWYGSRMLKMPAYWRETFRGR